jgi:hypothetical protein
MDDDGADERDHAGEMSTELRRRVKGNMDRALGKAKTLSAPTGVYRAPCAHAALGFGNMYDLLAWARATVQHTAGRRREAPHTSSSAAPTPVP